MRKLLLALLVATLAWLQSHPAHGQSIGTTPGAETISETAPQTPSWLVYRGPAGSSLRPILGIAGGLNYELQRNKRPDGTQDSLDNLDTALAMAIFGVEGRLGDWVTAHLEFRRDAGNYGTSVWEGTISLTALDNYVSLEHWGFKLAGGIVTDPASVDFYSAHITDLFMADSYSRTPLLYSGFSRGQGLFAQYSWHGLTARLFFSAGNPLASTTSYPFGGNVSQLGSLIAYTSRSISDGNPLEGMELDVLAPSLQFESHYFEARAEMQELFVDTNTESKTDVPLHGQVYRLAMKAKLWDERIQPFANLCYRRNDMMLQSATPDPTQYDPNSFQALVFSGGLDVNVYGRSGLGANYAYVRTKTGALPLSEDHYLNFGATWWMIDNASLSFRYAKLITSTGGQFEDGVKDKDSFFLVLRLVI